MNVFKKQELEKRIEKENLFRRMEVEVEELYENLSYENLENNYSAPMEETVVENVLLDYSDEIEEIEWLNEYSFDLEMIKDLMYYLLVDKLMEVGKQIWSECKCQMNEKETDRCPSLYELNDISAW